MKEQDQEVMGSQKQKSCAMNKADPVAGRVSRITACKQDHSLEYPTGSA